MTVPAADAREVAVVRRALVDWLDTIPVSAERAGDIVLACYEAMANVIEHAYSSFLPGSFDIYVRHNRAAHRLTATISDHGRWRTPTTGTGGRGLPLLTALSDHAGIRTERGGTTVHLGWNEIDETTR